MSDEPGAQEAAEGTPAAPEDPRLDEALRLNEEAVAAFNGGGAEDALALFRQALEQAPEEPTIRANASRCLVSLGDRHLEAKRYDDAARDYHEAGGLDPSSPVPGVREALARYQQLRDRDALAVLEPVVRDFPDHAQAHDLLGRVAYRLGENARAIRAWEEAVRLSPGDAALAERLAKARRDEAIEKDLYVDLTAAHFAIKYDGVRDQAIGRQVSGVLERAYNSVGSLLGRYPDNEIAVVVYPAKTFRAATGSHGWVAGLYDGKIRVPAGGLAQAPAHEIERVLTHEYAHALLRAVGGPRVPTWLHEGFAQVAEGRSRAQAQRHLSQSTAPGVEQLRGRFSTQADVAVVRRLYAGACDFVHALLAQGGAPSLAEVLDRLGRGESVDDALRTVYGQTLQELHAAWKASLPVR